MKKGNKLFVLIAMAAMLIVMIVGLPVKSHGQFQPCVWPNKCSN